MDNPILTTKLNIPPLRGNLVARPALYQRLDEGLAPNQRLILISSPAGFGKTTLAASWLAAIKSSSRPDAAMIQTAWLTLDDSEDNLPGFLRYLAAALRKVRPEIGEEMLALLELPSLPPAEGLLVGLINELSSDPSGLVLVLDDYHKITAPDVHAIVETLINHAPEGFHLVILTRHDPPLPMARWRARGQMIELRQPGLSFDLNESQDFFNATMGLPLTVEQVAILKKRTEGWITGLQMAGISLRNRADVDSFLDSYGGSHPFVFDYLAEEVLKTLPPDLVNFLTRTSVLSRLTAGLVDHLTGRTDGKAVLQQLEQNNLFLTALDDQRRWYVYHPLFADFIRQRLPPDEALALSIQAARWCESHTTLPEAIGYAIASGDMQELARLVRLAGLGAIRNGAMTQLREWLNALPEELIIHDPELLILKGWVVMTWNLVDLDQAAFYAGQAAAALERTSNPGDQWAMVMRGRLLGLQAYLAHARYDEAKASALAAESIKLLEGDEPVFRATVLSLLGQVQSHQGEAKAGLETIREAVRVGELMDRHLGTVVAYANIIGTLNEVGRRREAVIFCDAAKRKLIDANGRLSPLALFVEVTRAILCYEANQLAEARQILDKGFEECLRLGFNPLVVGGKTTMVLIMAAQGDLNGALAEARRIYREASQLGIRWVRDMATILAANLEMREGNLRPANAWVQEAALSLDKLDPSFEESYLTLARWLLAVGRLEEAVSLIQRLAEMARNQGRMRGLITLHILTAEGLTRLGLFTEARHSTMEALNLAAPEDYLRAFLDEGEKVYPLLLDARELVQADPGVEDFINRLSKLFGEKTASAGAPVIVSAPPAESSIRPDGHPGGLVESLSPRELEVLALIAGGLSNPEIARRLYLTVNTLKAHTNSIYGKLDVHSRMAAVIKARSLGLIH